ncbi:MAG: glycosyltransferase [Saprospiraceae bacterium]
MERLANTILIAIYAHPENYPPTLNAIEILAKKYDQVIVFFRANLAVNWTYPENVVIIPDGKIVSVQQQMQLPVFKKIKLFTTFTYQLYRLYQKHQPSVVLLYDAVALLAWSNVQRILNNKPLIWYHNHDKIERHEIGKYSIGWFALRAEKKMFPRLSLFSLPSNERKQFFPMKTLMGQYSFLPNYPALSFYQRFEQQRALKKDLNLVYQGAVNDEHGLEEIINILGERIDNKTLHLTIYGSPTPTYRVKLMKLAEQYDVQKQVHFGGRIPYRELPAYTGQHHIGIAINKPKGIIYKTGGTASNKIYEYAALGLPVLYFDSTHYRKHLAAHDWAFATDLTVASLLTTLQNVCNNYQSLSRAARKDFSEQLNFEANFQPILKQLA